MAVDIWSFGGDHGWKLGEYGDWCKYTNFELDTNAPLIFSVPGQKTREQASKALVEFIDIFPTLVGAEKLRPEIIRKNQ